MKILLANKLNVSLDIGGSRQNYDIRHFERKNLISQSGCIMRLKNPLEFLHLFSVVVSDIVGR